MKLVTDYKSECYIEVTQAEVDTLMEAYRDRPDFSRMSLEGMLAYRFPVKTPDALALEEEARKLAEIVRPIYRSIPRREEPSTTLYGLEVRIAPVT